MPVTLLFSSSRKIGGRLIEWTTWSEWSHVEIVCGASSLIGANYPDGVAYTTIERRQRTSRRWAFVEVWANREDVMSFARRQLLKPYDARGALGIAFRRDWQEPDAWFCSELVAAALAHAGVHIARVDQWRVTPQDLWQSPLLRVLRQGRN